MRSDSRTFEQLLDGYFNTFYREHPADATHVKFVEGDLDRQVEIIGIIGRLHFELVEAR